MKGLAPTPPLHGTALDPLESALGFWNCCASLAELWWSRHGGVQPEGIARSRLETLVAFARERSPFYRERYRGLPGRIDSTSHLPALRRAELMSHFDELCTDREVRRGEVERFLADRGAVGRLFLGRYHVWKSSGTSGVPGLFVQDAQAMAVYEALVAAALESASVDPARLLAGGGRSALVIATGDHYASITAWQHLRRVFPAVSARSFSVLAPLARLVRELDDFQPAYLASYPSVLSLLACEQRAGRLRIAPALVWSGGESLSPAAQRAIEGAFGCTVMNEYGSSECLAMAHGCRAGWLHVDAEWVILEPVDADGRPTAPGATSHTVLVTNLANRVQPILRYDLGDRITLAPGPCPCGSPLPAIRVEGRSARPLELRGADGSTVPVPRLALETAAESAAQGARFQVARIAPDRVAVRVDGGDGSSATAKRIAAALRAYLAAQSLANVRVTAAREAPRPDRASGKLASVVAEAPCRATTRA